MRSAVREANAREIERALHMQAARRLRCLGITPEKRKRYGFALTVEAESI